MEIVQPHRVEPNEEDKSTKEKDSTTTLDVKGASDVTNPIQTKAKVSNAMAVMDQIGGRLAACIWIFSKTMICNGHTDTCRVREKDSIMEAVKYVCADVQDAQDWVCEFTKVMHGSEIVRVIGP